MVVVVVLVVVVILAPESKDEQHTPLDPVGAVLSLVGLAALLYAIIEGPTKLKAAQIVCPPALRPSALILIAMLGAEGTSTLRNVYSIQRGYAEIAERLNSLGAQVEVVRGM